MAVECVTVDNRVVGCKEEKEVAWMETFYI